MTALLIVPYDSEMTALVPDVAMPAHAPGEALADVKTTLALDDVWLVASVPSTVMPPDPCAMTCTVPWAPLMVSVFPDGMVTPELQSRYGP